MNRGFGTEKIEDDIKQIFPEAKVARMDLDTTRTRTAYERIINDFEEGKTDILIGTQMIAKGHDFRRITLVAALNPDTALFSSDFRAPERLFSLLLQAGGRAGRDAAIGSTSELWVQTRFPAHALFGALQRHDYPAFAAQQLEERAAAGMPPFSYQALVRAESREQQAAQDFLNAAGAAAADLPEAAEVFCYPAIPMTPQRVANRERAQMLLESGNRTALQRFLPQLAHQLHAGRTRAILRWAIDVDPLGI